jgi:hypothetical protein
MVELGKRRPYLKYNIGNEVVGERGCSTTGKDCDINY